MLDAVSILDGVILIVLFAALLLLLGIRSALGRLEGRLEQLARRPESASREPESSADNHEQNTAFERFLAEDPARVTLPKSEQAAAYRQWRRENGMNWSHS
ncbi:MAG TPA: hypothetical protein VFY13_06760 [Luteolibacter sp.]|nr:hypothetical protein [Luteolibacter sp.]